MFPRLFSGLKSIEPRRGSFRFCSIPVFAGVLLFSGCVLKNEKTPDIPAGATLLPDLTISSSLAAPGDVLQYRDIGVRILNIDQDTIPTTISFKIVDGPGMTTPFDGWFVYRDKLLRFSSPERTNTTELDRVLVTFHDIPGLQKRARKPADGSLHFAERVGENDLRFYEEGFLSVRDIRDNDPLRREDDSAIIEIWQDDQKHAAFVREFSSFVFDDDKVVQAGEIFTGRTSGKGSLDVRVLEYSQFLEEAVSSNVVTMTDSSVIELENGTLTFTPLPALPQDSLAGEFQTPDQFRALLMIDTPDLESRNFILIPNQSLRWGRQEFLAQTITPSEGVFLQIEHELPRYPTERLSPNDPVVTQKTEDKPAGPDEIISEMEVGDVLDFAQGRFELIRIIENNPTDLFDDQVVIGLNGPGIADNIVLREEIKQTFQGNNRYWVIKADRIQKRPNGGSVRVSIETGKFIGRD